MWATGFTSLAVVWLISLGYTCYQIIYPTECPHVNGSSAYRQCFEPLIGADDRIDIHFFVGTGDAPGNRSIWSAFNQSALDTFNVDFVVPIPPVVRTNAVQLNAWIVIEGGNKTIEEWVVQNEQVKPLDVKELTLGIHDTASTITEKDALPNKQHSILQVRTVPDPLKRMVVKHPITLLHRPLSSSSTRNLLDSASVIAEVVDNKKITSQVQVQHWKYGLHPLVVRWVHFGNNALQSSRVDVLNLHLHTRRMPISGEASRVYQYTYEPLLYVDDLSLMRKDLLVMSENVSWPDPKLRFRFTPTSVAMHAYKSMMTNVMEMAERVLGEVERDELRYWMSDERLTRYLLTQAITMLHLLLEYLAFRDDWHFFVGRENFSGISASATLFASLRNMILFLYLADSDTSIIVLFLMGKNIVWSFYKLYKVTKPSLQWVEGRRFPVLSYLDTKTMSEEEATIIAYDRYATLHVSMAVYPLVIGLSIYSLLHYTYSSWWSWLISSLADSVYSFGFISLCPQLYINYKLRSVAHLPMGAFAYKIFNTFIDDVFAFMVKMPLKHRIMTLRDDIVFLGFVYQWWAYRKDPSRTNEFGFKYDTHDKCSSAIKITASADAKQSQENSTVLAPETEPMPDTEILSSSPEAESTQEKSLHKRRSRSKSRNQ